MVVLLVAKMKEKNINKEFDGTDDWLKVFQRVRIVTTKDKQLRPYRSAPADLKACH
jgi:hypothetical protein